MSEMVERVAKELAFDRYSYAWENMAALWREVCRTEARRIIAAMREPTSEMIIAGCKAITMKNDSRWPQDSWQAMIDAALADEGDDMDGIWTAEVYQDGARQASVTAPTREEAMRKISHYAADYEQDGPVEVQLTWAPLSQTEHPPVGSPKGTTSE